jgi:hypothetical protein
MQLPSGLKSGSVRSMRLTYEKKFTQEEFENIVIEATILVLKEDKKNI